jgi:hypothetical protein
VLVLVLDSWSLTVLPVVPRGILGVLVPEPGKLVLATVSWLVTVTVTPRGAIGTDLVAVPKVLQ